MNDDEICDPTGALTLHAWLHPIQEHEPAGGYVVVFEFWLSDLFWYGHNCIYDRVVWCV